jgi:Tol biopolymer transport system component
VVNVVDVDSGGQIAGSTIYVIRADGSGLQQLTAGGTYDAHPVWAP